MGIEERFFACSERLLGVFRFMPRLDRLGQTTYRPKPPRIRMSPSGARWRIIEEPGIVRVMAPRLPRSGIVGATVASVLAVGLCAIVSIKASAGTGQMGRATPYICG